MRGEVKWQSTLRQVFRDVVMPLFGMWIIYKEVESANPNAYFGLLGFGFMVPAARSAIISILSGVLSSSQSLPPPEERPSRSSSSTVGAGEEAAEED